MAVVSAAIILGQPATLPEVIGGAAILAAAAIVQRPAQAAARSPARAEPATVIGSHE